VHAKHFTCALVRTSLVTAHRNRKSTLKVMTALFGAAGTRDGEFGDEPRGGGWPSDHSGVAAKLLLPDR
jgi:hypothetical protein